MGTLEKKTTVIFKEIFTKDEIETILYRIALNRFQKEKEFEKIDPDKLTHEVECYSQFTDIEITIKYEQSHIEEKSIIDKLENMSEEELEIHKQSRLNHCKNLS